MHRSYRTLNEEDVYTAAYNTIISGFYAHCSAETNFYCFYIPRNTLEMSYKYNEKLWNTYPDDGVHRSWRTINEEGVYTQVPIIVNNANIRGFYAHCSVEKNFSMAFMHQGILWKWSTSTMKPYEILTQNVVCTDQVEH